jgi:hypothetical protein
VRKFKLFAIAAIFIGAFIIVGVTAYSQYSDPCTIYPHQTAFIPNGTPTSKLIAGVNGQNIYVCRVSLGNTSGTPVSETFFSGGEANASGTPCATATTGAPAAVATQGFIVANANTAQLGGDGARTLYRIGTNAAGFPIDFCGLMSGGTGGFGHVDYVQR